MKHVAFPLSMGIAATERRTRPGRRLTSRSRFSSASARLRRSAAIIPLCFFPFFPCRRCRSGLPLWCEPSCDAAARLCTLCGVAATSGDRSPRCPRAGELPGPPVRPREPGDSPPPAVAGTGGAASRSTHETTSVRGSCGGPAREACAGPGAETARSGAEGVVECGRGSAPASSLRRRCARAWRPAPRASRAPPAPTLPRAGPQGPLRQPRRLQAALRSAARAARSLAPEAPAGPPLGA